MQMKLLETKPKAKMISRSMMQLIAMRKKTVPKAMKQEAGDADESQLS
jgi:hypothetical protein